MVAGAVSSGMTPSKSSTVRSSAIDKGIDYANRIAFPDVVVNRLRQKRRMRPIRAFDESPDPILPHLRARIVQCFV